MRDWTRRSFLGGLAAGALAPRLAAGAGGRPPNILLYLIDDLGWADLGCYGSRFHRTPCIDALAAGGMRFTDAYAACPVCSPTRASLMTGRYPASLDLTDWIAGHRRPWARLRVPAFNQQLPLEEVTLAEALRPAGYTSAMIGKWHLGGPEFYPEHQGFDRNLGGTDRGQPPTYFDPYRIPTLADRREGEYLTDRLADEAVAFIEQQADQPWFCYLSHFAVHTPIQAKAEMVAESEARGRPEDPQRNARYAAMVESVDQSVGQLDEALRRLGQLDNTLVIFASDNGGLAGVTSNAPLRAGKGTLYEGGIRTPLIVRWPGRVRPGSRCPEPVTTVDLYPTALAAVGIQPAADGLDGVSLWPLLSQTGSLGRDAIYWHYPHYHPGGATPGGAIRSGDWKLIECFEDRHLELYHLAEDTGEVHDLAGREPARAAALWNQLAAWRRSVGAKMPVPNPDYDPARANQPPARR